MTDHELKTWPNFFRETIQDQKRFEYRKDDRGFMVGDTLWLREYNPAHSHSAHTGRNARVLVTGIWHNIPGMAEDHCIMQIKLIQVWEIVK